MTFVFLGRNSDDYFNAVIDSLRYYSKGKVTYMKYSHFHGGLTEAEQAIVDEGAFLNRVQVAEAMMWPGDVLLIQDKYEYDDTMAAIRDKVFAGAYMVRASKDYKGNALDMLGNPDGVRQLAERL